MSHSLFLMSLLALTATAHAAEPDPQFDKWSFHQVEEKPGTKANYTLGFGTPTQVIGADSMEKADYPLALKGSWNANAMTHCIGAEREAGRHASGTVLFKAHVKADGSFGASKYEYYKTDLPEKLTECLGEAMSGYPIPRNSRLKFKPSPQGSIRIVQIPVYVSY